MDCKMIGALLKHFLCIVFYVFVLTTAGSFLIPFWIWKSIARLYVYVFKPDVGESLSGKESMFAVDQFYKRTFSTNVKIIFLEGNLNIDTIRNGFIANVLSAVDDASEPQFKKLYQIPKSIGGYYFWTRTSIDVLHQIREGSHTFSEDTNNHENEFNGIMGELMSAPFKEDSPIWEIILFRGYRGDQSFLVFRFHHSLGDGYSFNHLIDRLIQKTSPYPVQLSRKGFKEKTNLLLTAASKVGNLTRNTYIRGDYYTNKKQEGNGLVSMTTLDLESMKSVRRATKTHFATVGMTLLAGALRRVFLELKLPEKQLPNHISIMHSLPKPNHPLTKIVNHWGVGLFKVQMQPANALQRLLQSERNFKKYIDGQYDELIRWHIFPMMGLLPSSILQWIFSLNFGTAVGFTSMPAYDKEAFLYGQHKILDIFKVFGLQWCQSAVTGAIYTHNGKVSFSVNASKDIVPDQAVMDRLVKQYVHDELQDLMEKCRVLCNNNLDDNHSPAGADTKIVIE